MADQPFLWVPGSLCFLYICSRMPLPLWNSNSAAKTGLELSIFSHDFAPKYMDDLYTITSVSSSLSQYQQKGAQVCPVESPQVPTNHPWFFSFFYPCIYCIRKSYWLYLPVPGTNLPPPVIFQLFLSICHGKLPLPFQLPLNSFNSTARYLLKNDRNIYL